MASENFEWEMYLVPNGLDGLYAYVKTDDVLFRRLKYFDSTGAICELKSVLSEAGGSLVGFEIIGNPEFCKYLGLGYDYVSYRGNINGTPYSITGFGGIEMLFLTPKQFFSWNDKTDDEFFFENYLVPESETGVYGFMVATDPSYRDMIFYDTADNICYMVADYDHLESQVLGFSIVDPHGSCSHFDNGWTYTTFVTNTDQSPNSMTGPDGQRWYFLTL